MPLSTSSSKSWWFTWLGVLLLVGGGLSIYEWSLSRAGYQPSVETSKDLWSWRRMQADNHDKAIVLLGASRMQLGLNTRIMRHELPDYRILPLVINGQYPMATLQSLAADKDFSGIVLMSFMAQMLEPRYADMQQAYNDYYQNQASWYLMLDAYLGGWLQSKIRFMHPRLGMQEIINTWDENHHFPEVFAAQMFLDGSIASDYSNQDKAALVKHFVSDKAHNYQEQAPMNKTTWNQQVANLISTVETIESRGGKVVLVRFPTDKGHWRLDERYYPKAQYWDDLANRNNLTMIHFQDYPGLASFDLPDSSHLDYRDAVKFTEVLLQILRQEGVF